MAKIDNKIVFNGINGSTGKYATPPMTIDELASVARTSFESPAAKQSQWFDRVRKSGAGFFAPMSHLDAGNLADVGWGVIFPHDCDAAVIDALEPLLTHRQQASGNLYKALKRGEGYRPGESVLEFLARHGHAPSSGPVDPEIMPYYLLLVGGPEKIPFAFQYQLDVSYAVGRIAFDKPEDYANYARSVVDAETDGVSRSRTMQFFGVRNEGDAATQSSASLLVDPLHRSTKKFNDEKTLGWTIEKRMAEEASKAGILNSLTDPAGPAFLFTASHGMGYDYGDPKQQAFQGALLCQDWPGPDAWSGAIPEKFLLAGSDIASDADVHGLISFHFACFGAGTPEFDDYVRNPETGRPRIAESPFLGALPTRLLTHPRGGALACVGHIERAWTFSFTSGEGDKSIVPFRNAVNELMKGIPIGHAMEALNSRFAGVAANFTSLLEEDRFRDSDNKIDAETMALKWIEHNDARSYVILGDPFVSVKPDRLGKPARERKPESIVVTKPDRPKRGEEVDSGKLGDENEDAGKKRKKPEKKAKSGKKQTSQAAEDSSFAKNSGSPGDFAEITNFNFVDPETGRRVTITASAGAVEASYPYRAAWEHIASAKRLLGAGDVAMGEAITDDSGRTILQASYTLGEGEETVRQHFGVVRDGSGNCLQFQLAALPDDASAAAELTQMLTESSVAESKAGAAAFAFAGAAQVAGRHFERVGVHTVALPEGFRLQGTRRFLSGDGKRAVEIDFDAAPAGPSAKPFALPSIGARSQFGKVEEVPRFLRSPIRYEVSSFTQVGPAGGATAIEAVPGRSRAVEPGPLYSKKVEIGGRPATIRFFGEQADAPTARAATEKFLESLE